MYRVDVEESAEEKIRLYIRYIAVDQKSPQAAERMLDRIWDAIDSLELFPFRCPLAPENEFREPEIRMKIFGPCVLLYNTDEIERLVTVIGFRHCRRSSESHD